MADLSQLNVNNTDYNLKDAAARNDIQSTKVVSGNPITLTDCAPINAESLVVELEPKQDLHGQSAPYVGGAEKNKLPMTVDGIKAINDVGTWTGNSYVRSGVTFTILTDNGGNITGINVDGTANARAYFALAVNITIAGDCVLSGCPQGGSGNTYMLYTEADPVKMDTGSGVNIYYDHSFDCRIFIDNGVTVNNLLFKPMIRLATESDPTFAPYSNICPITGYTECEVDDVGKNLIDPSTVTLQRYLDVSGNVQIDGGSDWSYTDSIEIISGQSYTLSGVTNMGSVAKHCFYDADKTFLSAINTTEYTFTAPNNAKYVWLSNRILDYNGVMLEKGSTATPYEPYTHKSVTIQFGQTVYGGSVDFKTGVLTVTHKCVDMGDLMWNKQTSVGSDVAVSPSLFSEIAVYEHDDINFKCSKYRPSDLYDWHVNGNITIGNVFAQKYVNVCNSDFVNKTNEEIQTMLQGVQLWYELATPFTIQLTPDDLKLHKGTNNITTNGTTINLGYQPDNVIGELKGEIEKCAVDAEFMQFTDGTDTFTDVNLSLDASFHTVSVVGSKIEQKRFICFEVMDKMGGALQGILASCIAFTDGAKTPSGTAFRAYIESLQMYVNFRIYGSGGSYTLAYQSETSFSASAFYLRVRMMNNL